MTVFIASAGLTALALLMVGAYADAAVAGVLFIALLGRYAVRLQRENEDLGRKNRYLTHRNSRLSLENRSLTAGNKSLRAALVNAQNTSRRGW